MTTEVIPDKWKEKVCSILNAGNEANIQITMRAQQDFFSQFPNAWRYELYGLLRNYLEKPNAEGRSITALKPPGEAYDFICSYSGENVYAKINLLTSGDIIVIVSAHRPLKGDTL